jgi:hypothetical protein
VTDHGPFHFEPREGAVTVVFDIESGSEHAVADTLRAAGFHVERYGGGGARAGQLRIGARRRTYLFTAAEQDQIVADFEAAQRRSGFTCVRQGIDSWTAGDSDNGQAGVREPRLPHPRAGIGTAEVRPPG